MIVGSDDGSVFSGLDDGIGVCRANRHAESVRDQFRVDAYASQRVDYCGDRDFLRYRAVAGVLFRHRRVDAGASVAADRGAWPGRCRRGAHRSGTSAAEEEVDFRERRWGRCCCCCDCFDGESGRWC